MLWFLRKEVFMTNKSGLFGLAQRALKAQKIPFDIRTANNGSAFRRTGGILGSVGENAALEVMYYLYTSSNNASKAEFLINEAIRNNR